MILGNCRTFNPNPHVQTQQQWLSEGHVTQSRVLDALRLLRTSPSVEVVLIFCRLNFFADKILLRKDLTSIDCQRTVVSLASDSAVWDAMMRNESVRELRASFSSGLFAFFVTLSGHLQILEKVFFLRF